MTKEEFLILLDRYIKGECSAKEQQYFDGFFNAFQTEKKYAKWDFSRKEQVKIEIYQSLINIIDREEADTKRPTEHFWQRPFIRIAASVTILLTIGWVIYSLNSRSPKITYHTKTTGRGQRATVKLSDGSVVKLNVGSAITFPNEFSGNTREVTLQGEAFFNVSKDPQKPFIVNTGHLRTTVLGTSFNITAYGENQHAEITVRTGKVQVSVASEPNASLILSPNQKARYHQTTKTLKKYPAASDRSIAWMTNVMYLDNTPMNEVITTLEKWYNVEIVLENNALGDCLLSGKYKGDRLVNILEGLKFMQGIEYRFVNNKRIVISGKKCKQ